MNKLGFGLMRLPHTDANDAATIDFHLTEELVDEFMANGNTYFDTAWMYNNFASEKGVKTYLSGRKDRNTYTIATKLNCEFFHDIEGRNEMARQQFEHLGVDVVDYYLLHGVMERNYEGYEKYDCFNYLLSLKKEGKARHVGFSFHGGPELLEQILIKYPDMEFVQLQINYLDWENPAIGSKACYEVCKKYGKPVIVMEPVKGGTLAELPVNAAAVLRAVHPEWSPAFWAIRFAASLQNVMIVLSGMNGHEMLQENLKAAEDPEPMTDEEMAALKKVAFMLSTDGNIPCTACSYCVAGCPMSIPIPKYFALYNADRTEIATKKWTPQGDYYRNVKSISGAPGDCLQCGQCESVCPQGLPIIENLKVVKNYFEGV